MKNKRIIQLMLFSSILLGGLAYGNNAKASTLNLNEPDLGNSSQMIKDRAMNLDYQSSHMPKNNYPQHSDPSIHYKYYSARKSPLKILRQGSNIYFGVYEPNMVPYKVNRHNQLVHLDKYASGRGVNLARISYQRHAIGWVRTHDLMKADKIVLPHIYVSQFWPSSVGDACEEAALKMALSTIGAARHKNLKYIVKHTPRSKNPNKGYTKNPYKYGTGASIYPRAMVKVAKSYGVKAKVIDYPSIRLLKHLVQHGDSVVFEGSYRMKPGKSDHVLTLLGYSHGRFFFADPFSRKRGRKIYGWCSGRRLISLNRAKKRGGRAMVVFY